MVRVATFVFFHIETTGLPEQENNGTRITELCMIAVKRDHMLEQTKLLKNQKALRTAPIIPRVVNKLTLCLNPGKRISDMSTKLTGLSDVLLEHEVQFNEQVFIILDNFLRILKAPVCLISHNGHGFDFPIFKNHLELQNFQLADDLLCADSLYAVYDIEEGDEERQEQAMRTETAVDPNNENDPADDSGPSLSTENATKRRWIKPYRPGQKRSIFYENNLMPILSYKLLDVHERLVGSSTDAHRAEGDCIMLLEIAIHMGNEFLEWVDENQCLFRENL